MEWFFNLDGVACEDLKGIEGMLVVFIVVVALAVMMSLIASYVSCYSCNNQEQAC